MGSLPRRFLQTADLAGVGVPALRAIIEDFGAAAPRKAATVIEAAAARLPHRGPLSESVTTAINERSRLWAVFNAGAAPR